MRANSFHFFSCAEPPTNYNRIDGRDRSPCANMSFGDAPWAMTAHVVYRDIDETESASTSPVIIGEIIRGELGFDGVLLSDDLGMKALGGEFGDRAAKCIAAGCDIVLHCSGDAAEMRAVADAVDVLSGPAAARFERAIAASGPPQPFDRTAADNRLAALLNE